MAESLRFTSRIISDRGPAEYFHGRTQILCDFEDLLRRVRKGENGTTFLIQGTPGAGKTALLYECEKRAIAYEWDVTNIEVGALWDPV
ncbi:MAG: ATP-binding protein [Rhodothermaceae bacterium]|nr:ATP-binding protein [Rhodothermaceae bacterium]MYE63918.1 ATP-binding protein [Rhodothermaceae bacterium]MYJ19948.1 ATP-binding protein [Rhodothermaceae bacterium]